MNSIVVRYAALRCLNILCHFGKSTLQHRKQLQDFLPVSGTKQRYLLVTLSQLNELHEYTPTGSLQRKIQLQPEMRGLRDAIHVDNDCFLITHDAKDLSRVCLVACNGKLITSYGGSPGSGLGQLDGPHYLALASDGFVFVSCCNGNRVVLLNKDLEFVSDIIPTTAGMKKICTIYFDEHHEHLYVSNFIENTLSVFWLD